MNIDQLRTMVVTIQTTLDRDPREAVKYQFYEAVKSYIDGQLEKTEGKVTREILTEIDTLYDAEGNPSRLAEMLGMELKELQEALGRERQIACSRCGKMYKVLERRRIGGFTELKSYTCKPCSKVEWENTKQRYAAQGEKEQRHVRAEAEIDAKVRRAKEPLRVAEYRAHILTYLQCWLAGDWAKTTYSSSQSYGNVGCMFCGDPEVLLFLTRDTLMEEEEPFFQTAKDATRLPMHLRAYSHLYPLLETYHQVLWRISPSEYFSYFPDYPLVRKPLLCLCEQCGASVEESHIVVPSE